MYETAPVGGPPQGPFLNAAVRLTWTDPVLVLLEHLYAIEHDLGRVRGIRNGPRTIDLDILWGEGLIIDSPRLVVPHPRLHERAFAVAPLLDVMPGAVAPRNGKPYVVPAGEPTVFDPAL